MNDLTFINEDLTIEDLNEEILDLYHSGYTYFDEIPDNKKIILLAKLCKTDLTWLKSEYVFECDYEAPDKQIKDKVLANIVSHMYAAMLEPHPFSGMDNQAKSLILAAEVYFADKIDDLFDRLREVPALLDEIFHRED